MNNDLLQKLMILDNALSRINATREDHNVLAKIIIELKHFIDNHSQKPEIEKKEGN